MSTSNTITKTDLTNILNNVLPNQEAMYSVKKYTASSATSVAANGGTNWLQVRLPSTINPISVVGYYLNGGSGCSVYNISLGEDSNGKYASFALRNGSTTTASVTADVFVLCWDAVINFPRSVDYIVEQGTDAKTNITWTYRKWNSGISECWGRVSYTATGATAWGNVYWVTPNTQVNFPSSLFTSAPTTTVTTVCNSVQGWGSANNISSSSVNVFLMRPTTVSSGTVTLEIMAKGRWK